MGKSKVLAWITVLCWATLAPIAKVLIAQIPDMEVLFIGAVFAFLFLLGYNVANGKIAVIKTTPASILRNMICLGVLGLFLYSSLYYYGLQQLTSQEACILNYLWPIMTVLFTALILKEKLTAGKLLGLLLSFIGIVILSIGRSQTLNPNAMLGIITCIVAAACYGLFSALNKKLNYDQDITMMIIWLTVTCCSGIAGLISHNWVPVQGITWIGLLWLGVVVNAIAYLLWAIAINNSENTASIANLAFLVPLLSMILAVIFLKEPFQFRALIAMILIIGGIILQEYLDRINK